MTAACCLQTGQVRCFDTDGHEIPCAGSGQDGEFRRGLPWPENRFEIRSELVLDRLTGLTWTHEANVTEFPVVWQDALDFIADLNSRAAWGFNDWRLPNRRELRSLLSHQTRKPPLPVPNPFINVFPGWHWTATTAAIHPAYAWYVHMEGGRMFYGRKDEYHLVWPVRGTSDVLPVTGQKVCFDTHGRQATCSGTGQDGEIQAGSPWPAPRFDVRDVVVTDHLTGLQWTREADVTGQPVSWASALSAVESLSRSALGGKGCWRLPNINELESLVDGSSHNPALPRGHPFQRVQDEYWSSTTSAFEPDWAWALYLHKGAVGVGRKRGKTFRAWAVCDGPRSVNTLTYRNQTPRRN